MGAVVTGFTVYSPVVSGHAVQGLILGVFTAVTGSAVTAGFAQPGTGIICYISHSPVAVYTVHALLGHNTPQTFSLRARMTAVTAGKALGNPVRMLSMNRPGEIREARNAGRVQCI